jgi:hypothetical protein
MLFSFASLAVDAIPASFSHPKHTDICVVKTDHLKNANGPIDGENTELPLLPFAGMRSPTHLG